MEETPSRTSFSLLMRIRVDDRDPDAWREFVDRYGKRIFGWCVHRRLYADDAQEVTQDVLLKLSRRLGSFEYDPGQSFRGWLRRVTENAIVDYVRDGKRHVPTAEGPNIYELLQNVQARKDLQAALEEAFDLELFDQAVQRVQGRVSAARFQAWKLTAHEGRDAADVACQLNMKIATVYSARHYVQSLIAAEVQMLENTAEEAAAAGNEQ